MTDDFIGRAWSILSTTCGAAALGYPAFGTAVRRNQSFPFNGIHSGDAVVAVDPTGRLAVSPTSGAAAWSERAACARATVLLAMLEDTPEAILPEITAVMDCWMETSFSDGMAILFGFMLDHHSLGGLSWCHTSPIETVDEHWRWARTASGSVYALGPNPFIYETSPDDEARAAFETLVLGPSDGNPPAEPTGQKGDTADWLASCKMARWLGIDPPSRIPAEIKAFIAEHLSAYVEVRNQDRIRRDDFCDGF